MVAGSLAAVTVVALTFATLFMGVVGFLVVLVFVLGLPGRIAIARRHPDADAVRLMGLVGFLAVVPWVQALIWAFKPTNVIDIRHFPKEEQQSVDHMLTQLADGPSSRKIGVDQGHARTDKHT